MSEQPLRNFFDQRQHPPPISAIRFALPNVWNAVPMAARSATKASFVEYSEHPREREQLLSATRSALVAISEEKLRGITLGDLQARLTVSTLKTRRKNFADGTRYC